MVTGFWFKGF